MCVKLSIPQERDYGELAPLQVRPLLPLLSFSSSPPNVKQVHTHLYQFAPKSFDLFPYHKTVFFSCPSRLFFAAKMSFSHANPSRVKNARLAYE